MIIIALPNELTPEENIKLTQKIVRECFVNEGMCADFSIHSGHIHSHKNEIYPFEGLTIRKNNPHAHIQVTVRPINKDGTWGAKSKKEYILDKNGEKIRLKSGDFKSRKINTTNWDDTATLIKWRENLATITNRELERLRFDERIDHRSLKAQGIDREPTIHMGHEAWQLEKKGIKTVIGDKNRAIMERNRTKTPEYKAEYMHELKQGHYILDKEIAVISTEIEGAKQEIPSLQLRAEEIKERVMNLESDMVHIAELKTQRESMGFFKSKKAIEQEIQRLEESYERTVNKFKRDYDVSPEHADTEVRRLVNKSMEQTQSLEKLRDKLTPLIEEKESFTLEYQRQKLLADISPDRQRIQDKLAQLDKESRQQRQSPKDNIVWAQNARKLDNVSERNFQEILKQVTPEQAWALIEQREVEKLQEHERIRHR